MMHLSFRRRVFLLGRARWLITVLVTLLLVGPSLWAPQAPPRARFSQGYDGGSVFGVLWGGSAWAKGPAQSRSVKPRSVKPRSVKPRSIAFSAAEYAAYEDARQKRNNTAIVVAGTTTIGGLLVAGVALLAIGFSGVGRSLHTTLGVSSLSLATLGGFTALELYEF